MANGKKNEKAKIAPAPLSKKKPIIVARNIQKQFQVGKENIEVLHGISLTIYEGEFVIVYGPSGSGKSTLLNTIIGLEQPTSGSISMDGIQINSLSDDRRAELRAKIVGVVAQQPIWVKALSVIDNVMMPLLIANVSEHEAHARAEEGLKQIGLMEWAKHKPTELSGGQQQRINLVRALVNNPKIIFLDEPTGNLDTHSADQVLTLLRDLNKKQGRTLIMVTHNLEYLVIADRTIMVRDGVVNKVTEGGVDVTERYVKEQKR